MKSPAFKVGLFVFISIAILIFGYFYLIDFKIGGKKYYYRAKFKDVSWLAVGDAVTIRGVPKGRVEKIQIYPGYVLVTFSVRDHKLREGSVVILETQGVLGEMRLCVKIGKGKELPEGSIIPSIEGMDVNKLINHLGLTIAQIESLIMEIRTLVKNTNPELKNMTQKTQDAIENFSYKIESIEDSIQSMLKQLRKTGHAIDTLINDLNYGKGTLGKILKDSSLYIQADSLIRDLRNLIKDFKKNPSKYIRIKIF